MVLADGCFDPLHYGHIRYLAEAAAFGPVMVRVATDEDITKKGRAPFQWRDERAMTVAALRVVDGVTFENTLEEAIERHQPSYLVKGIDWQGKLSKSVLKACEEAGTQVLFIDTQERTSSERLIV